jgi:hypothetical protein
MVPGVKQQKSLEDGATLYFSEYRLDAEGARILKRPINSYERVLTIKMVSGVERATNPKPSHYLSGEQFLSLYGAIQNRPDFERVDAFLRAEMTQEGDNAKLEDFLATF